MTSISDSTNFLMDPKLEVPTTFNNKLTYESDLVKDAQHMNIVHNKGYPEKLTFQNVFPPVCLKSHWDAEALSKHVLPEDLRVPLPVDPRPLFRNCVNYFNLTPINEQTKLDAETRSKLSLSVQPGGSVRAFPFELYKNNVDKESDLYLNHPQNKCDGDKWVAKADSDLYVNNHRPVPNKKDDDSDPTVKISELSHPLATIINPKSKHCRNDVDSGAWNRSARFFNNPTREDRMPGHTARLSEAPLGSKGPRTGRVALNPKVWTAKSIVFYMDSNSGYLNLSNLALALRDLTYEVTIFSTETTTIREGISYHHVNEFVPNDIYATLIMWGGSDLLENFQYKPQARALLLNLDVDEDAESVCSRANKDLVDKIVVKSAYHRSLYNCFTWSKFEVIPSALPANLFIGANRLIERQPFRVLVTSYSKALIPFYQHAWIRLKAEFPLAELHIFETAGDDKKTVLPALLGLGKDKGIYLNDQKDLDGMVKERFASRVHVYLEDDDLITCEPLRLSALAGCIPIMPERGVYNEIRGINIPGPVSDNAVLVNYAKAISTIFKNPEYANKLRTQCQSDPTLLGTKATAERWLTIINGLTNESKPFSSGKFNSLFK